jgi:hypothetical protein
MKKVSHVILLSLLLFFILHILPKQIHAEGTYSAIGTTAGESASSDAVSWSQGNPIMIDAFGNYIVPVQKHGQTTYYFNYSNNKGSTWSEITDTSMNFRPSAAYDSINDKIHVLIDTGSTITYKRYIIKRNKTYGITDIVVDPGMSTLTLDSVGSCTSITSGSYPIMLWKNTGTNGTLVAFWTLKKTCSGTTITQTRAAMRALSNTSADATASNWKALDGTSDAGSTIGPASVDFDVLYTYTDSVTRAFQHAALIRGGSGSKSDDIYYFNIDENSTFGFRRLGWSSGSSNWSGSWTSRATFGGNITNSSGYNAKDELLTKPVYDSNLDRVYVGIGRYLSGGSGDTQTIFYVDSSDNVSSGIDVYSAGGSAWFAPTLDIAFNSANNKLYIFFLTSSRDPNNSSNTDSSFNGKVYYKTYDNSGLSSTATGFFTTPSPSTLTVDIPIVYPSVDNDRLFLFFRVDGANSEDPYTPPHKIYSGYISSGGSTTTPTPTPLSVLSGTFTDTTYANFIRSCYTKTNTQVTNVNGGEVTLASGFHDEFDTPTSPYTYLFNDLWNTGVWSSGTFNPTPGGTVTVYGSGGAYMIGRTTFSKKTLEFRAKFTQNNFQHVGWTNDTDFGSFIIFSTFNQPTSGHLYARTSNGTNTDLGAGYLGDYHTYKIEWGSDIKFYIDDSLVATINENISANLVPIASNNDTNAGSDLTLDWMNVSSYSSTTGSFQSCTIDSGYSNGTWGTIIFSTTGSTTEIQTRTSSDNATWSSWSTVTSGSTVGSAGRYLQYIVNYTGTSTTSPSFNSLTISATTPTPTPTNTPTPTPTNTPTPTATTTPTPTSTPTNIPTPTPTNIPTPTGTPTNTPTPAPISVSSSSGSVAGASTASAEPTSQTSHIFITRVGDISTLFISSADSSTYPKAPINVYSRDLVIEGIVNNGGHVGVTINPGNIQKGVQVKSGNFSLKPDQLLEYGTYSVSITLEQDGKRRSLPTFEVKINPPLAITISSIKEIYDSGSSERSTGSPEQIGSSEETKDIVTSPLPKEKEGKEIEVLVKDKKNNPISGAEVMLYSQPKTTYSDEKGVARFENVEPGDHTLVVNYDNQTGTQKIQVDDNPQVKKLEMTITLEPKRSGRNIMMIAFGVFIGIIVVILFFKIVEKLTARTFYGMK